MVRIEHVAKNNNNMKLSDTKLNERSSFRDLLAPRFNYRLSPTLALENSFPVLLSKDFKKSRYCHNFF